MELDSNQRRMQAHSIIDGLPDDQLAAAFMVLEGFVEPLEVYLARVPREEEELSPEMAAALEEAHASLDRGEFVSHEEVLLEFGL